MTLYDSIGQGYAQTRAPDHRLTERLIALLNLPAGATILDVGAGTGKYARALAAGAYSVIALEPSEVMQAQGVACPRVRPIRGAAEKIPLSDHAVDGVIVVLIAHHFEDRPTAYREMARVVGTGLIVFFTFDPSALRRIWLAQYFPEMGRKFRSPECELENAAAKIERSMQRKVRIHEFPLPPDLEDRFGASGWSRPELYLNPEIRKGMSDFSLMDENDVQLGLQRLEADLSSGRWDSQYGALRTKAHYDAGFRFIVARQSF